MQSLPQKLHVQHTVIAKFWSSLLISWLFYHCIWSSLFKTSCSFQAVFICMPSLYFITFACIHWIGLTSFKMSQRESLAFNTQNTAWCHACRNEVVIEWYCMYVCTYTYIHIKVEISWICVKVVTALCGIFWQDLLNFLDTYMYVCTYCEYCYLVDSKSYMALNNGFTSYVTIVSCQEHATSWSTELTELQCNTVLSTQLTTIQDIA